MSLHPQAKAVLDMIAAQGDPPLEQMIPAQVRASRAQTVEAFAALAGPEEPVARKLDRNIPGPAQPIPVRIYWPETGRRLPVLVYFHGGGWVFGNLDQVDRVCRMIANRVPCIVVSVDYRLAPEHKFPAAAEDAYAAVKYIAEHAEEFDADVSRVAVGGDSAGGNLAAVTCLMARDRGGPSLAFQLLVYPVTDYDDDRPSTYEYAEGHLLTRAMMPYFWDHYVSSPGEARHPYASPINAESLAGLPPALVITAECDPIRDQGEAYARRLEQAGVAVRLQRYEGAIHAFFQMGAVIDSGKQAVADATTALRGMFSAERRATA
jgi:acetyl esterase